MKETNLKVLVITYASALLAVSLAPIGAGGQPVVNLSGTVLHIVSYFVLSLLLSKIWNPRNTVVFAFSYGVVIEIMQGFTGYRIGDFMDAAANGVGILAFYLQNRAFPELPWNRQWKLNI